MSWTEPFARLSKNSAHLAGGKGASLGEMTQAGIPVPPGFVVLSTTFDQFIQDTDLVQEIEAILAKVDHEAIHTVDLASEQIKELIESKTFPEGMAGEILTEFKKLGAPYVAVRSSATAEDGAEHAWAGQLESYLNTTEETLLTNVKKCWASLFTPRAIFYRFEKGLHATHISVAVVIQKMVQSEKSGIAFSVHPVTEDRNQLIIEAGLGLGEAIVSGSVTPDSYVVTKSPREILDVNVSHQTRALYRAEGGGNEWRDLDTDTGTAQVLTPENILALSEIILTIENHYGFPCDIEWAYEAGKFYIVQSRPITTLSPQVTVEQPRELALDSFADVLECIQKNTWDVKEARASLLVCDIVFYPYAEKNCFGQTYSPLIIPLAKQTVKQVILQEKMDGIERNICQTFIESRDAFDSALREANEIQAKIDTLALVPDKLEALSDSAFQSYFTTLLALVAAWWRYGSIGEEKGLIVDEKILPLLEKNHGLSRDEAREYVMTVTTPDEQSIFSKERLAFLDLCLADTPSTEDVQAYAQKYFYARSDFYSVRTLTEESVRELIAEQKAKTSVEKLAEEREHILVNFKRLPEEKEVQRQKISLTDEERKYVAYFSTLQMWIDTRKLSMSKHLTYIFWALAELSRRTGISYDTLSLLTLEELRGLLAGEHINVSEVAARDAGQVLVYLEGQRRLTFSGEEERALVQAITETRIKGEQKEFSGAVASKGKGERIIQGRVRIVMDPSKEAFHEGEILVTSMTRPEFVPIMKSAKGIITDEGGIACHAAIVSRELSIPCIIGTKIATQILKTGDLVEMDAGTGTITVVEGQKKSSFVSPELRNFNPDEYIFEGLWKNFAFPAYFWVNCYRPELLKALKVEASSAGVINLSGGYFFNEISVIKQLDEQLEEKIAEHNEVFFKNMVAVADSVFTKSLDEGQQIREAEPTVENFRRFVDIAMQVNFIWLVGATYFTKTAEKKLQESVVAESFPAEHVMDIIPELVTPLSHRHRNLVKIENVLRGKSFAEIQADPKLSKLLEKEASDWPWIEMLNFIGEPLTPERVYEQIVHVEDLPQKSNYSPENPLSTELSFRARCLHDSGYLKQAGAEYFSILSERVLPFLHKIGEKIGVQYRELISLTPPEIEAALLGKLSAEEVRQKIRVRTEANNWVMISKDGGGMTFVEEPADVTRLVEKMVPRADAGSSEVKGQIGNPGKFTGRVKVIMNNDDFHRMEANDVLVSTMTTPDFVILMQKSGAIVTDIGGMLCHAAIVSREINVPCVIGTKFATQILKDGDLVEVDADKGIVRILEKSASTPTIRDFELSFEAQGVTYIYEHALYTHYLPKKSVSIITNGVVQEFMHKDTLREMNAEGLTLTPQRVRELIQAMNSAVEKNQKDIEQILQEPLTGEAVRKAFANAGAVTHAYYFFDPHFFDGIFAQEKTNPEAGEVVRLVQEYKNVAREYFNKVHFGESSDTARVLHKVSESSGVPFEDLQNYSEHEVIAAMGGARVSPSILSGRKEIYVLQATETGVRELHGDEARKFALHFQSTRESFTGTTLKGKVAHAPQSHVRGVVRCITRDYNDTKRMYREMEEMKQGEILVTQTTDPEMMPALRKASAAITDIGGMLSHTAITARELGIPCIVDTKFATQVLKNGDTVEVDADKGMVRILEKTSLNNTEPFPHAWDKNYWSQMGRWVQRPLPASFWIDCLFSPVTKDFFPGHTFDQVFDVDGYFHVAKVDQEYYLNYASDGQKNNTLTALATKMDVVGESLLQQHQEMFASLDSMSLRDILETHSRLVSLWFFVTLIGDALTKVATQTGTVKSEAEFFDRVHPHLRKTWIENEDSLMREIAQHLFARDLSSISVIELEKLEREDAPLQRLLAKYRKEYPWLGINKWDSAPHSPEQFVARVNETIQNVKAGNYVEQHITSSPPNADGLSTLAVATAYWRPTCASYSDKLAYALRNKLTKLVRPLGLSYADCILLTKDELIAIEETGALPVTPENIASRRGGFTVFFENGYVQCASGADAHYQSLKEKYAHPPKIEEGSALRGMPACKGKVTGRIKVVSTSTDFSKFEQDDILVAPETTPAYVPLMRKASAILTERGGITSHAAIVSRELRVPCIIAVAGIIATLKDGDLVEVDAEKGIVRILES